MWLCITMVNKLYTTTYKQLQPLSDGENSAVSSA